MINKVIILFSMVLIGNQSHSQVTLTNDGLALTLEAALVMTIEGHYTNQTNGANLGTIANAGTISLTHDWTNNSLNDVFTGNTGSTYFVGTANGQSITGSNPTKFFNLTFLNNFAAFPQITLGQDFTAENILTLDDGAIDLNTNTVTVGRSIANPGSIVHGHVIADGFFFGGNLTRYFAAATVADLNLSGFFPLGAGTPASAGRYRPMYLSVSSIPVGGTVTASHTQNANDVNAVAIADDVNIEGRHNSTWTLNTAGMTGGGSDYNMYIGGTGLGLVAAVSDLRVMLPGIKADGVPGGNGGTVVIPLVKRSGLTIAQLANTFHIGTIDATNSPLPIELIAFEARLNNSGFVDINWETGAEINNEEFVLERSKDGVNFDFVFSQNGAGNSTKEINYSGIDYEPLAGVSYYRLKQIDFDEQFSYTHLELVNNNEIGTKVYPIPAYDSDIFVELENSARGMTNLYIYDQQGAIVHEEIDFSFGATKSFKTISSKVFKSSGVYNLVFVSETTQLKKKIIFYK
ncbi:MAG: hypothetical protein ACJAZ2_000561 [Glaciecola sp.]|jgi:hypothetical protein